MCIINIISFFFIISVYALEIVKYTKNGCQSRKSPYPPFAKGEKEIS
jgi:hypothetical protein